MTVEHKVGSKVIRLVRADITDLEVEACVFDITEDCKLGSGYGGAIVQRGGKVIQEELDKIGSIETGQAAATTAGKMKAEHIIYTNGPKYCEDGTEPKLRQALSSVLKLASEKKIKQLALPPIGTGLYQVPIDLCARVMMEVVADHLKGETSLEEVDFVGLDSRELDPLRASIQKGA